MCGGGMRAGLSVAAAGTRAKHTSGEIAMRESGATGGNTQQQSSSLATRRRVRFRELSAMAEFRAFFQAQPHAYRYDLV